MAIDRNSYTSLVESVQEAVATPTAATPASMAGKKTGKMSQASGSSSATSAKTNAGIGAGARRNTGWGSASVGGASNAMELAAWLNSLQGGSKKPSMSRASTPKMKGGSARGGALSTPAGRSISTSASAPGSVADSFEWSAEDIEDLLAEGYSVEDILGAIEILSEEEDFDGGLDVIDEIIAEGIELYGEEEFIEILEHFNETGEISEELLDLLNEGPGSVDQMSSQSSSNNSQPAQKLPAHDIAPGAPKKPKRPIPPEDYGWHKSRERMKRKMMDPLRWIGGRQPGGPFPRSRQ